MVMVAALVPLVFVTNVLNTLLASISCFASVILSTF